MTVWLDCWRFLIGEFIFFLFNIFTIWCGLFNFLFCEFFTNTIKKKHYFVPILSLCLFVWLEILNWFWSVLVFFFSLYSKDFIRDLNLLILLNIRIWMQFLCPVVWNGLCFLANSVIGTLHWFLEKILISLSYGFCVRLIWLHMIFVCFLICDLKLMTETLSGPPENKRNLNKECGKPLHHLSSAINWSPPRNAELRQ